MPARVVKLRSTRHRSATSNPDQFVEASIVGRPCRRLQSFVIISDENARLGLIADSLLSWSYRATIEPSGRLLRR
jgi:hypothetical protein